MALLTKSLEPLLFAVEALDDIVPGVESCDRNNGIDMIRANLSLREELLTIGTLV